MCSNHFSILLDCGSLSRGPGYFKFDNMWLKFGGFLDKVQHWWFSYQFQGSPSFVLACKFKSLKKDTKVWNEQVFGNVEGSRDTLLEELKGLKRVGEERVLSVLEKARKTQVIADVERLSLLEEIS